MLVEICANSYQSAVNSENAGADRIELCAELSIGGITPSYGLLKKVMQKLSIPVFVLIRPRSGDFTFSEDEFSSMKEDIQLCKELGCSGIVSGVLQANNTIDIKRTQELLELSKPLNFTFHRAFDWVKKPIEAFKELEKIGVDNLLTSGQKESAEKGLGLLLKLKEKGTKTTVLPGGGICKKNVNLFKRAGFKAVHLSATSMENRIKKPLISMNSVKHFDETKLAVSNVQQIKECIEIITNEI